MRVLLLGPFEVRGDDERPVAVAGTRVRALLARLAMEPGRVVSADALIAAIWQEQPPANGANALQALVSRARRAVGGERVEGRVPGYRLVVEASDVDAYRFERLAAAGRERGNLAMLREAEALWRGPALADLRELRFAADAAVRYEELRLSAAGQRLALELAAGEDVLAEVGQLAEAHPLSERLQGLLIRALYAAGRQAEALAAFQQTRDRLAEELGADPSPELAELHVAILRHEPDPPAPQRRRRTNLRAPLTSFVGREDDLAKLADAVAGARLVTVIGPGGAGKTRLASEVAARIAGTTGVAPDGVWLVELAAVTDPLDVAAAVLRAIGTRDVALLEPAGETGGREPLPAHRGVLRLGEFFGGQRALLILDNCEHLAAEVAELAGRLLGSCPGLRVLATSREPLTIGGERLYPIRPLRWPSQVNPAGSPDDLAAYPAVRLFVERASAVRPDFALAPANAPAVVEICRRLDGMPLAIELAAGRMRALGVAQIAARLDDRFSLLSSGDRTALPRHQTLRAVIDWSWEMLSAEERELAMWLAVFPAGTTLDAVDHLAALTGLVDKSLVEHAGDRYRMLETVRSYVLERLTETGRATAVQHEQARYLAGVAEAADAELRTVDQLAAMARLTAEHENLLAALRFAVATEDLDLAVRLLAGMFWFWGLQGIQAERRHWTQAVLDLAGAPAERLRPAVYLLRGLMQYEAGLVDAGEQAVMEGIAVGGRLGGGDSPPGRSLFLVAPAFLQGSSGARAAEQVSYPSAWAGALTLLLSAVADGGDDGGLERLERAKGQFEALGDRFGRSSTLRVLAEQHALRGDLPAAVAALTAAVGPIEELGVDGDRAELYAELATALTRLGELDRAEVALREAWESAETSREAPTIAYVRLARGEYWLRQGDRAAAWRELDTAESDFVHTALGPRVRVWCAALRALAAVQDGDPVTARRILDRAATTGFDGVAMPDLAAVAHLHAAVAVADGEPAGAAYLIGVAAALIGIEDRRGYDSELHPAERARELLGADAYAEAFDRGAALRAGAAIEVLRAGPVPG